MARRKKYSVEQILRKLREAEVELSKGQTLPRVCRKLEISEQTYYRWRKGHDMQTRAYDNAKQGIDRVVRSVLSWEACARAAEELDMDSLTRQLAARETAKAEDVVRGAVVAAQKAFDGTYRG